MVAADLIYAFIPYMELVSGKYNKESSVKKKNKKAKEGGEAGAKKGPPPERAVAAPAPGPPGGAADDLSYSMEWPALSREMFSILDDPEGVGTIEYFG